MKLAPPFAIAQLTVRDAIRSRLLASLAILLLVGTIGLPLLISGDNTLAGQLQVTLNYTLTFVTTMLSAVTLWASCGGMSAEIQDRRLYLVVTRPIHRYELWLGKWLGIVLLNAALLALSGLTVGIMLWHGLQTSNESTNARRTTYERFLLAHTSLWPDEPDLSARIKEEAQQIQKDGRIPAGFTLTTLEQSLAKEHLARQFQASPGKPVIFSYRLPEMPDGSHDLILSYRFDSTRPERTAVPAEWKIGANHDAMSCLPVTNYPGIPDTLIIPGSLVKGASTLTFEYHRKDPSNPATLLMAANGRGPELLVYAGPVAPNIARGLLIIFCRLAFLAALGLTAGSLLSMPVAVFVAFFIMTVLALSGYVETVATTGVFYIPHEGPAEAPTWIDVVVLHLFKGFNVITQPLQRFDPIPLIQEGRLVSWTLTAEAGLWLLVLYTSVTAAIGVSLFNRRELG